MNEREQECLHFLKSNIKNKTVLVSGDVRNYNCLYVNYVYSVLLFYFILSLQLLASGGVDSTVCAALLSKVVPRDKLIVLHIDNGFMRKNESQEVVKNLSKLGLNVIRKP